MFSVLVAMPTRSFPARFPEEKGRFPNKWITNHHNLLLHIDLPKPSVMEVGYFHGGCSFGKRGVEDLTIFDRVEVAQSLLQFRFLP